MQTICWFIWSQSIDETVLHSSHVREADVFSNQDTVLDENELESLVNIYATFFYSILLICCLF
jgi:hypothetical protein